MVDRQKKFEVFEAEMDGVTTSFKVYEPNAIDQREANKIRNRTFYDAVNSGAFLKTQIKDIMRERDLWNDAKQREYSQLENQLIDGRKRLDAGGFAIKDAKDLALQMHQWRSRLVEMTMDESQLTNETAEGQADNASFNYLVSACVVYNDSGQSVFSGMDDYLNRSTTDLAIKAARCLAALIYGVRSDIEKQLPENEFLLSYGFVNDDLRLVNENGELVNLDGELVSEDGGLVSESKEIVRKPFVDEKGKVVKTKEEKEKEAANKLADKLAKKTAKKTAETVENTEVVVDE